MQISPISVKTNAVQSFGALLFKIDRTGYSKEGFIKQGRNDKKFRDEFLKSLDEGDRKAVEDIEKWSEKNTWIDILIARHLSTQDITVSTKRRESAESVGEAAVIGKKYSKSGLIEIDPQKLVYHLGRCYTEAEMLKDGQQPREWVNQSSNA